MSFCKGGDEYQYISEDHQSCIGFSIEHGISLAFDEGINGVDSCVAKRKMVNIFAIAILLDRSSPNIL